MKNFSLLFSLRLVILRFRSPLGVGDCDKGENFLRQLVKMVNSVNFPAIHWFEDVLLARKDWTLNDISLIFTEPFLTPFSSSFSFRSFFSTLSLQANFSKPTILSKTRFPAFCIFSKIKVDWKKLSSTFYLPRKNRSKEAGVKKSVLRDGKSSQTQR